MRSSSEPENSAKILERVIRSRDIQLPRVSSERQKLYCRARMLPQFIRKFCEVSADCSVSGTRHGTTGTQRARAHDRILRVARDCGRRGHSATRTGTHCRGHSIWTLDRTFWAGVIVFEDACRMSANLLDSRQLARHNPETRQSFIANWVTIEVLHATNL